jgi:hypothetical protein
MRRWSTWCSASARSTKVPCILLTWISSFTRHALYTALDEFNSPCGLDWHAGTPLVDYSLGLDKLSPDADQMTYTDFWMRIHDHLRRLPSEFPDHVTKLLLAGDSVTNDIFLSTLQGALRGLHQRRSVERARIYAAAHEAATGRTRCSRPRGVRPSTCGGGRRIRSHVLSRKSARRRDVGSDRSATASSLNCRSRWTPVILFKRSWPKRC